MRRRLLLLPVAGLLVSCAPTTYDESIATTTLPSTTTTLPVGTLAEILPVMLDEAAGLSTKVMNGSGARLAADRIGHYWDAIEAEVTRDYPEFVEDFEFVVTRCRLAADRKRPADADRAYRNLQTLADALL